WRASGQELQIRAMKTKARLRSTLNRGLARQSPPALGGGSAVAARLGGQRLAIENANPPPPHFDQALILKPAQCQRHRFARRPDQAGQILMRQRQTDLPCRAVSPTVRLDQLLQQGDNPLAV